MADVGYKPGIIRRLKLINFMCHESFELVLGPRANFIIGPNGSGKSALLTALVVVLGGRASTTSRAKRANDFVQYGKKYAKIICEIHNYEKVMEMEKAFKPDEYGKFIVIEKTIMNDEQGGTRLVLRNDHFQRVSERKQELDEMLEHFGILINNPICILNQEISKTFLHSKRPEDKFVLFMKATNLEQIESDYNDAKLAHSEWHDVNDRKSIGYRLLDNEYQNCKEKVNFLIHRLKLEETLQKLNQDFVWASVRDHEDDAKRKEKAINDAQQEITSFEAEIAKRQESIEQSELKIEKLKLKAISCNQESELSKKKVMDHSREYTKIRTQQIDIQHVVDGYKRKLDRLEREKAAQEKAIEELRKKLHSNTSAQDTERRKLEISQLQSEVASERAREASIRTHSEQLSSSMTEIRNEMGRANMKVNELKNAISDKNATLRRLIGGQENEIKKYGEYIYKIHEEIERAHKAGRFIQKPRGPLGHYIKLKSADVAAALEVQLGKNAHAFTCDNIKDLATLNLIMRNIRASSYEANLRDPLIMTRKFRKKHEVSRFKAHHHQYKTMLDYIDIDEDSVYNAIVDRTSLEQILFIPDFNEAQNLMITPSSIPRNTRCAYTKDCYVMYPKTASSGFRCMASGRQNLCLFSKGNTAQIKDTQREIDMLKKDEAEAIANAARITGSYDTQRAEYQSNQNELRTIREFLKEKEGRILDLTTTLGEIQSDELPIMETELEKCSEHIISTKKSLERESTKLAEVTLALEETTQEKMSAMEVLKQKERERAKVSASISSEQECIRKNKEGIEHIKIDINRLRQNIDNLKEKLNQIDSTLAEARKVLPDGPRPSNIAPTESIKREIEKINAQLRVEIEENQDPDELMEALKKRMSEIDQIIKLKDHNLENFELTSKSLNAREEGFRTLRQSTCNSVSTTFASVMRAMGMMGQLNIHMEDQIEDGRVVAKGKTLEMSIDTTASQRPAALNANNNETPVRQRRETRSQPPDLADGQGPRSKRARLTVSPSEKENKKMTDTRSLSGGERSFSTVAFVLSLWHHCASPFKLMDEIDVFMDMVTRRMSYNALIQFAEVTDHSGQFIFFSPLELPKLDRAENLVRVFEMPRIIRRGVVSQSGDQRNDGPSNE